MSARSRVSKWWSRRKAARAKAKQSSAYAGASRGRLEKDWIASSGSPNLELVGSLPDLRNRTRKEERDDPHAHNAALQLASYMSGIMPRSAIRIPEGASDRLRDQIKALNRQTDDAFTEFAKNCNARGRGNYRGFQFQAVLGMIISGGSLTQRRIQRLTEGLLIPLQLELLEDDFLDHLRNEDLEGGGWTKQGVEHSPRGRVAAYHLHRRHPGGELTGLLRAGSLTTKRVTADRIAHLYSEMMTRPSQVRGVPWPHAVLRAHRQFSEYMQAERVRMRAAAAFMGAVKTDEVEDIDTSADPAEAVGINPIRDARGRVIERVSSGEIAYLRGGQELEFNKPPTTDGFADYVTTDQHAQAAGWLLPHSIFSGSLKDVNFSSIMFGMGPFLRLMARQLLDTVVTHHGDPTWDWFITAGKAVGELPAEAGPRIWVPEPWPVIDPVKQARANLIKVRTGSTTLQRLIWETGDDPDDVLRDHETLVAWAKKNEIVLDSIPSTSTLAGQEQESFVDPKLVDPKLDDE